MLGAIVGVGLCWWQSVRGGARSPEGKEEKAGIEVNITLELSFSAQCTAPAPHPHAFATVSELSNICQCLLHPLMRSCMSYYLRSLSEVGFCCTRPVSRCGMTETPRRE
ncbi:hypothetical protein B0I37DRAFT_144895 [Chaetomium sp. MPI-CAGE-AT-0009]|nr:hypothetical protein B0I37DRAFT_144895 [Chaetomium sp. MPI-CAGE-AT-0009]